MSIQIETEDLGVRVENIKPRKEQSKHSGFFITLNTNYRPGANEENAEECAHKLRKAVKAMLTEEERLKRIVNFLDGQSWNADTISKVSSEFVVERGRSPRGGRIHSHISLHIDHWSKIRLNIPAIKEEILPFFSGGCTCNIKNLYVNVRIIKVDLGLRNYLRKES